jgi:two-component system OmpR family sensor kinase
VRRSLSLRVRLVAALVLLLTLVLVVVGGITGSVLRGYLVGRLDTQLAAARDRTALPQRVPDGDADNGGQLGGLPGPPGGGGPGGGPFTAGGPGSSLALGQAAGTLGARISGGMVTSSGVLAASGSPQQLGAAAQQLLLRLPTDGRIRTRSVPGVGEVRILAVRAPDGDVFVTGLPLAGVNATITRLLLAGLAVAGVALAVAAVAGTLIVRWTLRPLARVATVATRVAELPLERGEVELADRVPLRDTDPRTEVGQVAGALNHLLEAVDSALGARQASEMRVRQFVADASHELRTPLAAIRGYAELTRRNRDEVPEPVAYALGRVESEAQRMTGLVEDLLLLARLDSGRPLEHAPVDLSVLAVDAVSDAHVAGPDHVWQLDLPEAPVVVEGDALRLHQVLANLLANARTHTPAGTTVTVRLTRPRHGQVLLAVTDSGPGIAPELQATVFERFARGDSARARAAGSTGLGLAIVAAVVHAHGGTVDVDSAPGRTAFSVRLPVTAPTARAGATKTAS